MNPWRSLGALPREVWLVCLAACMGLYAMAWGASFTVGPGLGKLVYEHAGGSAVWIGCFAFAALAVLVLSRLPALPAVAPVEPSSRSAE